MAAYDQIILFGDSLFQHSSSQDRGFSLAAALQSEYIRRLDVVNRGFRYGFTDKYRQKVIHTHWSGYNTDQGLRVLPKFLPAPEQAKVRFVVIFFGANDACLKGVQGSQHVPVEIYKQNLVDMISHPAVKQHNARVIVVTPPPVNEYAAELNDQTKGIFEVRRTANHTAQYAVAAREAAEETGAALLDLWLLLMTHAGWKDGDYPLPGSKELPLNTFMRMLLHDGLHFTHVAYTLYFQELMRVIGKVWPDQLPENLPYVFPEWLDPAAWKEGGEFYITK